MLNPVRIILHGTPIEGRSGILPQRGDQGRQSKRRCAHGKAHSGRTPRDREEGCGRRMGKETQEGEEGRRLAWRSAKRWSSSNSRATRLTISPSSLEASRSITSTECREPRIRSFAGSWTAFGRVTRSAYGRRTET